MAMSIMSIGIAFSTESGPIFSLVLVGIFIFYFFASFVVSFSCFSRTHLSVRCSAFDLTYVYHCLELVSKNVLTTHCGLSREFR
jgi:hypothetical protein